jgi:oxaloacetate decarboxylase alpha subunit
VIQKKATEGEEPITCRPGERIPAELKKLEVEAGEWITQPEDILSYAMFPQVATEFLRRKYTRTTMINVGLDAPIVEGSYPV